MANIVVRRALDAHDTDAAYRAAVARELAQQFVGIRCLTHGVEPQLVATIRKGGQVEIEASGCCRQLADAVNLILAEDHRP